MPSILDIPPGTKIRDPHMGHFAFVTVLKVEPPADLHTGVAKVWTEQYEEPFDLAPDWGVDLYTDDAAAFVERLLNELLREQPKPAAPAAAADGRPSGIRGRSLSRIPRSRWERWRRSRRRHW